VCIVGFVDTELTLASYSDPMIHTENTPEYKNWRKIEIYREAVAEAVYEGGISDRGRNLLARLRDSLNVFETEAEVIESRVLSQKGVGSNYLDVRRLN
jgi:hypothetical protein